MPGPKHSLVIIHDGLGDLPIPGLSGQTPLEAAHTPCMDDLARIGCSGLLRIWAPGRAPGTDIGHLALFGQDATNPAYQRGPMEAAGVGFRLQPGDIAVRFNFATLNAEGIVSDRRAGRIRNTQPLIDRLNEIKLPGVQVFFLASTEHRGVIVLRGTELGSKVSDSDPGSPGQPLQRVKALDPHAERTSRLLNSLIQKANAVLAEQDSPATGLLTRGAGSPMVYRSIADDYGLRVACVSGEATVLGLARLSGFDAIHDESMTANLDTDLSRKARETARCLHEYDLVYLHLKGCDIAAHDRSPTTKRDFIERTDRTLQTIVDEVDRNRLCVVSTADHATYSQSGAHHWSPIPLFISGPGIPSDSIHAYGERACLDGDLGTVPSVTFMESLFRYIQDGTWECQDAVRSGSLRG